MGQKVYPTGFRLGITEDWHIGVVRARDDLALALELAEILDDAVIDEAVVEIVLWLVNDEWRTRRPEEKQQQEDETAHTAHGVVSNQ